MESLERRCKGIQRGSYKSTTLHQKGEGIYVSMEHIHLRCSSKIEENRKVGSLGRGVLERDAKSHGQE